MSMCNLGGSQGFYCGKREIQIQMWESKKSCGMGWNWSYKYELTIISGTCVCSYDV